MKEILNSKYLECLSKTLINVNNHLIIHYLKEDHVNFMVSSMKTNKIITIENLLRTYTYYDF